ncbi:Lrp/AsnC ligand binding domain-containing protein [Rhizobium leguminosarum]|uniref:Lrp/AsnC ligand binding domain-containing protein n=1 Tax=Rhizobium leguminosarum TaxID=384 RepID=UPI003918D80C
MRIFRYAARYSHDNADSFLELSIPEVIACHLVSGGIDFLLEIVVEVRPVSCCTHLP